MPNLSPADAMEASLLRLDDDAWSELEGNIVLADHEERGGPLVTGDPAWDAYERELWEEAQRG